MKVDENLIEVSIQAPLDSKIPEADTEIIQRPNWYQVVTPSLRDASANEVILSRVADSEAEQRVEETFQCYGQLGLPFKWCIGPMSNCAAIEPRIRSRAAETWLYRGMAVSTREEIQGPDGIAVERVTDRNYAPFLDVFLSGWEMEGQRDSALKRYREILLPNTRFHYFLAYHAGIPAGVAGTVFRDGYGYLVAAVVLPAFRGKGIYRALLRERLKDLERRRIPIAVTHAREATSAPILERLGFETTFRAKIYRFN